MSNWRRIYLSNTLTRKYGILGRVASRYVLAGFSVRVNNDHILIKGRNESKVVVVVESSKELRDKAGKVKELAKRLSSKPVIAVYGRCKISDEDLEKVVNEGIQIKFIRC